MVFNTTVRPLLLLVFLLAASAGSSAQSLRAYRHAGDAALSQKNYAAATQHYAKVLSRRPEDWSTQWKYAECARLMFALPTAEKAYLQVAASKRGAQQFPLARLRLGEVKQLQGDYAAAIRHLEQFVADHPTDAAGGVAQAKVLLEHCHWAQNAAQKPAEKGLEIKHLDKKINSPYSDFAAVSKGDTLFFSSYRFEAGKDHQRQTRLMMSLDGKQAREPRNGLPAGDSAHVAHAAFSPDGHHVVFTFCKNVNAYDIRCELWMVTQDIRGKWTKPRRLPAPVNAPGHTSTQPMLALDQGSNQLRLWFASDRPGGSGGLDLWSVPLDTNWFCSCNLPVDARKPGRLPQFEAPQPVASVNTSANEVSPFYHRGSGRLYFSADGRPGFGGYDIFAALDSNGVFGQAKNLGTGFNTSYNDLYFSLRPDGRSGYLSSNRPGSFYLEEASKTCCNDIFAVTLPAPQPPAPPAGESPLVSKTPELNPLTPVATPIPVETPKPPQLADFVGLPLYFDNDEPDKRTRRTSTGKTYEETVLAFLDRQDEYRERRGSGLPVEAASAAEQDVDAFFDNEVRRGYERLDQLCDVLLSRLTEGERVEVLIKGFTSPRAESDYNLNLGKRRISSVRNHIAAWDNGVLRSYLDSGQLRVSETSFGETTASRTVSDDLRDERNSIYAPVAARERRVEIVEIKQAH